MGYGSVESQGYVSIYGDTMKGPINMGGNAITGLPNPTANDNPVTLGYLSPILANVFQHFDSGKFTGNGRSVKVDLSFTPKLVILTLEQGIEIIEAGVPRYQLGIVTEKYPIIKHSGSLTEDLEIITNGFYARNDFCSSLHDYIWIAFG